MRSPVVHLTLHHPNRQTRPIKEPEKGILFWDRKELFRTTGDTNLVQKRWELLARYGMYL